MVNPERETLTTRRHAKSQIPRFKTIEEEAEFWDTHSTTDFEDEFEEVSDVQFVVTRAKPKKAITVRLDPETAAALAEQAQAKGIGPSTLARMWILERLREQKRKHLER